MGAAFRVRNEIEDLSLVGFDRALGGLHLFYDSIG
jgi:hypothetical protein